eukprot:scaffold52247_cov16-Tisochrysis_lutea.AAC.1
MDTAGFSELLKGLQGFTMVVKHAQPASECDYSFITVASSVSVSCTANGNIRNVSAYVSLDANHNKVISLAFCNALASLEEAT